MPKKMWPALVKRALTYTDPWKTARAEMLRVERGVVGRMVLAGKTYDVDRAGRTYPVAT